MKRALDQAFCDNTEEESVAQCTAEDDMSQIEEQTTEFIPFVVSE